jgi:arsenate reductase-like glutaredoxin family protein
MNLVDWFYDRSGCKACSGAREFLSRHGIEAAVRVDAKKRKLNRLESFRLARQMDGIYATRKKLVVYLNLRVRRPDARAVARLILSPSGCLRAPAMRVGKTLVVGYHEPVFRDVLGICDGPARDESRAVGE